MQYAVGGNYRIDLERGLARCAVWRRPDLDPDVGAALAEELLTKFTELAAGPARGMIFDLRNAPPVNGPRTQAALGRMLAVFEQAGLPIGVVLGGSGMQHLQVRRLVRDHAPRNGRSFDLDDAAEAWITAAARA